MPRELRKLIGELVWPAGFSAKVGRIAAALSILGLARYGLDFGVGSVLTVLSNFYEDQLSNFLGWADEPIRRAVAWFEPLLGFRIALYPHWKHIFVLLGIYFFREAGVGFQGRDLWNSIFNVVRSLVIALVSSVAAATVPLSGGDLRANILVGVIPIAGAVAYGLIGFVWDASIRSKLQEVNGLPPQTWWGHYLWGAKRVLGRAIVGLALLFFGLQLPIVRAVHSPGLLMLLVLVLVLAFYWLWEGRVLARRIRRPNESPASAYSRSLYTRLGLAMLGVFFWLGIFGLVEAGEGLFHLL